MRNFKKRGSLIWFPLMPKLSKKAFNHDPSKRTLRVEYGPHVRFLPAQLAAELAGVSVQTVYKWINGTHPMDRRTRLVLYTRALGLLPHNAWRDWHIDETGRLTAPNGWTFRPDELMALTYLKQLNSELQRDVARLTVENRQLRQALDYLQTHRLPANVVRFPRLQKNRAHGPVNS